MSRPACSSSEDNSQVVESLAAVAESGKGLNVNVPTYPVTVNRWLWGKGVWSFNTCKIIYTLEFLYKIRPMPILGKVLRWLLPPPLSVFLLCLAFPDPVRFPWQLQHMSSASKEPNLRQYTITKSLVIYLILKLTFTYIFFLLNDTCNNLPFLFVD